MQIQYMREFIAFHKYGNFSKTAHNLYITQPALSRHIAEMEKELGVKLLERNKHSVSFTEAGLKVYKQFRKIIQTYDNMTQELSEYQNGVNGKLKLGMLYYTIQQDFGAIIPKFTEKYPNVEIKRFSFQPHEGFEALMEEKIDICVIPRSNYPGSEVLRYYDIIQGGMDVMMSIKHPLAAKKVLTLEDLKNEICIQLRDDPISNHSYNEALAVCGFTPNSVILTDNIDTVPFLLQKTNAIYIKAKGFSVSGFENEITMRDILEPTLKVTKSYAYRADNTNPLVLLFIDMVKKVRLRA
ncbi:LysR family transcriptional regulator [Bilifractor sp. LCP21S3_A7]|uniref:LysR family transcriptional regulator n=1 Tax=Bilifractor sp. LCP21S3_A7 TaxID=3438738 RepID=UPI003F933B15